MNFKKTFILWLLDKDTKQQHFNTVEAYKVVEKLVCKAFGGGTIYQSQGVFTHEDGTMIIEPSIVIMTITDKDHQEFVTDLKHFFNQESILVEVVKSNVSFE